MTCRAQYGQKHPETNSLYFDKLTIILFCKISHNLIGERIIEHACVHVAGLLTAAAPAAEKSDVGGFRSGPPN
jgi:hypothetical protein